MWTFYAARGIINGDRFDPGQIEEGLRIGLLPQINLAKDDPDTLSALFDYLGCKGLKGLPFHGRQVFSSGEEPLRIIESIAELDHGRNIVSEIIFHAGSVKEGLSCSSLDATFTSQEYQDAMEQVKGKIRDAERYLAKSGISLVIENVGQVNYFLSDKESVDPRWKGTGWMPEPLQRGDLGCAYDLGFITSGPVCIDIEHLNQSVEYSMDHNKGAETSDSFGLSIRKGHPILFNAPLDPVEVIQSFSGRIPVCHLGGQTRMMYIDNGKKKIGSHMPITFGADRNEFLEDEGLMLQENSNREETLRRYLRALHDAGCRRGVFEIHVGEDYCGERWRRYHLLSLKNVLEIVKDYL